MGLLDFLFPKYCVSCKKIGEYICSDCFARISFNAQTKCLVCDKGSFNGLTHPPCAEKYTIDGAFSSVEYKGVVKKLVYCFKYQPYVRDLQKVIGDLLYEGVIQNEYFYSVLQRHPDSVIVPIPLHQSKLKSRGYNQSKILGTLLSTQLHLPLKEFLIRQKKTTPQFGLKREERFKNIEDAFVVSGEQKEIQGKSVLLVDDVLTTGATLLSGAKALKKSGVKHVWGITLAMD